jgi:hypothetical protein
MSTNSDQKVVVLCDFSEGMKDVIVHGARMADILKKELCLTAVWKDPNQKNIIQENLVQTTRSLKTHLPNMPVSWLLLQKSLYLNMQKLVDEYNAVLLVLHQDDINWVMKAFQQSSIAFLFVKGEIPKYLSYKNVLVPVDYRRASKETSLWASYFGRFNHSHIQLIYARETNKDDAGRLQKNLGFFKKFLTRLNVRHLEIAGNTSSWGICNETLERANEWKGDLMIFSGSSSISLLDLMVGLPEKRIVKKAGNLPIMLINPRKDICMMCD